MKLWPVSTKLMVSLPTRLTVTSFFRCLGFTDRAYADMLELMYLGVKHFRMPVEAARLLPVVVSGAAGWHFEIARVCASS